MPQPDVVVLRQKVHGMPASDLRDAVADRLTDHEVALATTPDEERDLLQSATVAVGIDLDTDLLATAENLSLFACVYAGTSHLDLDAFEDHGVAVTNASGVHGPNVAEYVVGSMIAFAHRFGRAQRQADRREWRSYETREVAGSTVAVVGLGHIGEAVVERLSGFDVETLGVRYTPEEGGPTDETFGFDAIHEPLARSEYVVLACPLTDETRGLIDEAAFRTMPPSAVLVNVARGPVVDTDALLSALRSNAIRGAALDVTDPEPLPAEHPLWAFENVRITPHNAGHTPAYFDRVADILAENLRGASAAEGENGDEDGGPVAFEGLRNRVV